MKKNMKLYAYVLVAAFAVILSSCATIVSKSTYPLTVSSTPVGAKVTIVNKKGFEIFSGNTPATLQLAAGAGFFTKASYLVTIEKEGFEKRVIPVEFKLDGWYAGNIIFGGLLGILIIDPASGAMWKIDKEYINETLNVISADKDEKGLKVVTYNDVPDSVKKKLVKIK